MDGGAGRAGEGGGQEEELGPRRRKGKSIGSSRSQGRRGLSHFLSDLQRVRQLPEWNVVLGGGCLEMLGISISKMNFNFKDGGG